MLSIDKMLSTGYDVSYNSEGAVGNTAEVLIKEIGCDIMNYKMRDDEHAGAVGSAAISVASIFLLQLLSLR